MAFAKVQSAHTVLLKAHLVSVEVDLSKGLHAFTIVGLPDKAVEESRDRVSAAIKNSGFKSPKQRNQKIVVSLAPADLKKEGPLFDLGIAIAYLLAAGDIRFEPKGKVFLGELSLDGAVQPVQGVLPLVLEAKRSGVTEVFVPKGNAREAALIEGVRVFPVSSLRELVEHLNTKDLKDTGKRSEISPAPHTEWTARNDEKEVDISDIVGQESAKRGLEIAAAGGHNVAMWGPPGTGKTMLAKAFAGILPPLSFDEMLEVTSIHSVAGLLGDELIAERPFRAPHHTASYVSLAGGGAIPKPGEITLAHRGVLFLDEFPEFDRRVIETLRQPLEERRVSVARARGSARFPAHFILVAAMNPCPCGNAGVKGKECICPPATLIRYQRKISGPIIDRIDLWLEVGPVEHRKLSERRGGEKSETVRVRVEAARERQLFRAEKLKLASKTNSELSSRELAAVTLTPDVKEILNASAEKLGLSARAYHRIIKLARTIADLEGTPRIAPPHMLEALQYRPKRMASL